AQELGVTSLAAGTSSWPKGSAPHPQGKLDDPNAPWLLRLPGMPVLHGTLTRLRESMNANLVAVPASAQQTFSRSELRSFAPYEALAEGLLPRDAVVAVGTAGIMPFYLPDVTMIDTMGLTDAVVARTPIAADNALRRMAHDRKPPVGYLRQRGVNLAVGPAAASEREALSVADFAIRVADDVWMPLQAKDLEFLPRTVPAERLAARHHLDSAEAAANELRLEGQLLVGHSLLWTFETGCAWHVEGDAGVRPPPERAFGGVGARLLSTVGDDDDAMRSGSARSPEFRAEPGDVLAFFLAGRRGLGSGCRLCCGEEVVHSFAPEAWDHLLPTTLLLTPWAGRPLHLELDDAGPGWFALDQVMLTREGDAPRAAASRSWSRPPYSMPPELFQFAPLRSERGCAVSGATTLRITNPLPYPASLTLELIEGPRNAYAMCGAWSPIDGGPPKPLIPPGATVETVVYVHVPVPVQLTRQPFTVRLQLTVDISGAPLDKRVVQIELPLPWQEGN
ncbi:MAG: hypothetical protein ABIP94_14895, partial [Planctomycetota bacterium]